MWSSSYGWPQTSRLLPFEKGKPVVTFPHLKQRLTPSKSLLIFTLKLICIVGKVWKKREAELENNEVILGWEKLGNFWRWNCVGERKRSKITQMLCFVKCKSVNIWWFICTNFELLIWDNYRGDVFDEFKFQQFLIYNKERLQLL